jgi:D-aminoacyl-tRNA deacylase
MKVIVQRVSSASVTINGIRKSEIKRGYLILLGIANEDDESDIQWLTNKIFQLRIFSDEQGNMNLSLDDVAGEILLISQFTLHAKTKKGNRPSFIHAAKPEIAIPLYENFIGKMSQLMQKPIATGEFGADMKVELINDGPVTIIIDTKNKA